jgi:hypothetical protein
MTARGKSRPQTEGAAGRRRRALPIAFGNGFAGKNAMHTNAKAVGVTVASSAADDTAAQRLSLLLTERQLHFLSCRVSVPEPRRARFATADAEAALVAKLAQVAAGVTEPDVAILRRCQASRCCSKCGAGLMCAHVVAYADPLCTRDPSARVCSLVTASRLTSAVPVLSALASFIILRIVLRTLDFPTFAGPHQGCARATAGAACRRVFGVAHRHHSPTEHSRRHHSFVPRHPLGVRVLHPPAAFAGLHLRRGPLLGKCEVSKGSSHAID